MDLHELAEQFLFLSASDKETTNLLDKAMKDNDGQGINVHYHDQHFGWFEWDPKAKKHHQFSIADFKNKDRVGRLEDVVGDLKNVKLEDYK